MRDSDIPVEITDQTTGMWSPGILAVENAATGQRYYVGTRNLLKRYRDQRDWLRQGRHPNPRLQRDWSANPEQFRFVGVQMIAMPDLVRQVKQNWIDQDRARHGCYNAKNSLPRSPIHPPTLLDLLPPGLLVKTHPQLPSTGILDRIAESVSDTEWSEASPSEMRARAEAAIANSKKLLASFDRTPSL